MPIVNSAPRLDPPGIRECRPTYVRAIGTATAAAPTATAAVTQAKAEAIRQRGVADPTARAMVCPVRGGCAAGCVKRGRALKTGAGLDWTVPVKRAGNWVSTATAYNGYSINCYCPREVED